MCLFLLLFLLVLLRVCRRGARSYEAMARLPLHDDASVSAGNGEAGRDLS
jgi:cbb3-type cytochrome oxidase subunit 3